MRTVANDNHDTWQPLSLATERLLLKLDEHKEVEDPAEPEPGEDTKDKARDKLEYVEDRLRQISAWERRVNGGRGKR